MTDARLEWLQEAVSEFGAECKRNLMGPGDREAAIRSPLEQLFRTIAAHHARSEIGWYPETRIPHLGVRPDYAVRVDKDVTGYIEVKRPAKSIDPDSFTGHDKRQWERLRDLPNLLYTNGTHWRVFQYGTQVGEEVVLSGALKSAGEKLTAVDLGAFDALAQAVLCWDPPKIRRVSVLVQHIAPLCRLLREAVREQLRAEAGLNADDSAADRPFTGLRSDWRRYLFPTADDATFADGYAQTVTFATLLAHTEGIPVTGTSFHEIGRRLHAGHALMGKALQLLTDNVNERFEVTLNLLARTVAAVEWEPIRQGNRDAYLHLYESFLSVYDDTLRQRSGSYYTPHQVVEEMVRLAEEVLRTRLGKTRGYGDESVHIVDPAMGTGTYLHTVIERVARQAAERHGKAMAPDAIGRLAQRLYGFELQMGPFAVAELRTADLLKKHGAPLPPGGLNLHVTDTLDDPYVQEEQLASTYAALSVSRARANHVKANIPVTVVISNPPYDDKAENRGGWIEKRVKGQGRPPPGRLPVSGQRPLRARAEEPVRLLLALGHLEGLRRPSGRPARRRLLHHPVGVRHRSRRAGHARLPAQDVRRGVDHQPVAGGTAVGRGHPRVPPCRPAVVDLRVRTAGGSRPRPPGAHPLPGCAGQAGGQVRSASGGESG